MRIPRANSFQIASTRPMAAKRLAEIHAEIASILSEFPELRKHVAYRRRIFRRVDQHRAIRRRLWSRMEGR